MARLKGFQNLVSVENALQRFVGSIQLRLKTEPLPLKLTQNRVLAFDIVAETDLPRTHRSAVDGYAVKALDTVGATQLRPKIFQLTSESVIRKNEAKQLWTGSPIPRGADAVVMLEIIQLAKNGLEIRNPIARWENVAKKGEDIERGEVAVQAGTRMKPHHLGLARALGVFEVKVFAKPRIAVLATGNELAETESNLKEDQVYDSNRLVLSALCTEMGTDVLDLGIARDEIAEISGKLRLGLESADAIITSGGTSVGGPDLVPEAVSRAGKPGIIVHGVALRPGMPTALASIGGKPIIVLPGNPVAAMLGFEIFGRPLLSKLLGLRMTEARPMLEARMTRKISTALGRKNLVRVHVYRKKESVMAEPISARGSSLYSTMTKANGYVVVPENQEGLAKGDVVTVHMFDSLEEIDGDV